jgi:hypothetical protein
MRRHFRESQNVQMAMFLSPSGTKSNRVRQGLYPPHTGKATMPRTGTLPPSSCGKGPVAVGESVRVLPGSPVESAVRLRGKGSEPLCGKTAARVVEGVTSLRGARESRVQGQRRQAKELRGESPNGGVSDA